MGSRVAKDGLFEAIALMGKAFASPVRLELLDLLTTLNRERATTVVMVLHELNLAARYADHLVVMSGGRIVAEGAPTEVLTADTVRSAFGLEARIIADPVSGGPMVVPVGRFHAA